MAVRNSTSTSSFRHSGYSSSHPPISALPVASSVLSLLFLLPPPPSLPVPPFPPSSVLSLLFLPPSPPVPPFLPPPSASAKRCPATSARRSSSSVVAGAAPFSQLTEALKERGSSVRHARAWTHWTVILLVLTWVSLRLLPILSFFP